RGGGRRRGRCAQASSASGHPTEPGEGVRRGHQEGLERGARHQHHTLLAAALLFFFASGTVQGFGVTLSIGTVVSMFSALVIARVFVEFTVRRAVIRKHPVITGISRIGRVREWLVEKNPNLMKVRRYGLIVTALILVIA